MIAPQKKENSPFIHYFNGPSYPDLHRGLELILHYTQARPSSTTTEQRQPACHCLGAKGAT